MGLQNMQNQNMNLVLSTDAKPRLKWTAELHQRFVEAVSQLGGPDKATPKSLMRAMGVPGLTLYHLKSHLQKHRLAKSQITESGSDNKQEEYNKILSQDMEHSIESNDGNENHNQSNENLHITQAWQVQMEVQKKLHEQIEVQRHLQLRIEAQGKYLQSVLKKAQETLAGYNTSSMGVEHAKAELSHLVSMVSSGCPSSSLSELTETGGFTLKCSEREQFGGTICSMESSLTSSESSGWKEEKQLANESEETQKAYSPSIELPLMDINPSNQASGRKRSGSTFFVDHSVDQPSAKRSATQREKNGNQLRIFGWSGMLDLNSQYQNDIDTGSNTIDLSTKE